LPLAKSVFAASTHPATTARRFAHPTRCDDPRVARSSKRVLSAGLWFLADGGVSKGRG
jgi:hypothetical protein